MSNNELNKFDWKFYKNNYPDLSGINNEIDALNHWMNYGIYENRFCNKLLYTIYNNFDWEFYLLIYNDLDKSIFNNKNDVFKHYCLNGYSEKRAYNKNDYFKSIEFDWKFYVNHYSDLNSINNKEDAYNHWLIFGKGENRMCNESQKLLNAIDNEINNTVNNTVNNSIEKNSSIKKNIINEDYSLFDWEKYSSYYNLNITKKEDAIYHMKNNGKKNGYIFFFNNDYQYIVKKVIDITFVLFYMGQNNDILINLNRLKNLYQEYIFEVIIISVDQTNLEFNYNFDIKYIYAEKDNICMNYTLYNKAFQISRGNIIIFHNASICHYQNIFNEIDKIKLVDHTYLLNTIPYNFSNVYLQYFNNKSNINNQYDNNQYDNNQYDNKNYNDENNMCIISKNNLNILQGFNESYLSNNYCFKDFILRASTFLNVIKDKSYSFNIFNYNLTGKNENNINNVKNNKEDEEKFNKNSFLKNYIKWINTNDTNYIKYDKNKNMGLAISVYSDNYTPKNRIIASCICLNSIIKNFKNSLIIIVIDNEIQTDHYNFIKELIKNKKNIKLYKNTQNFGIAKTKNICIKLLEEHNVDYICLLDDDIEILDDFTNTVLSVFNSVNIPLLTNFNHELKYENIKIMNHDFVITSNFFGNLLIINRDYIKKYGYFGKFEYKWGDEHIEFTKRYLHNTKYENIAIDLSNYINNEQIIDGVSMLHVHSLNVDFEEVKKNNETMLKLLSNIKYIDFTLNKIDIDKINV
jgi:hypothetical protein